MPALITHHLFGEEAVQRIPHEITADSLEYTAFILGNQGPDPLFFRFRGLGAPIAHELGQRMHASRMSAAFGALRDGVSRLPRADAGIGRAFALGLLAHYALDRTAHPFVYQQQWGIMDADRSLADCGSEVHAVIETDIDLYMLQTKRNGATVEDCPPAAEIVTSERVNRVAGALMSYVASFAFGIEMSGREYGGAVADMQLVYQLIEPAGAPVSAGVSGIEGLVRGKSMTGALAHPVTQDLPAGAVNLARKPWHDPFTGEQHTDDFAQTFGRALDYYADAAHRFIAGEDMARVTSHVNYSGRPLGADEECTETD